MNNRCAFIYLSGFSSIYIQGYKIDVSVCLFRRWNGSDGIGTRSRTEQPRV
jgi:hypothetical protein